LHEVFGEFALLLAAATLAGVLAVWLRQPLLVAFIVVGIVVGPAVTGRVSLRDPVDLLGQLGVSVLLFAVGLKLDLAHVRHIGPVALATGLGQLAFTIAIGFVLLLALDRGPVEALYVAVALTFSSTIIIVKLLSDKRELDTLHGRIAVGFLIVQDLAVVIAMMAMSVLGSDAGGGPAEVAATLALRLGAAAVATSAAMRWVLPAVLVVVGRSQELLLLFAVAWGAGLAALGEWAGFSKEAGAFLAGFTLASTGYRDAIGARITGLRDFLLLFFFVSLGAGLSFDAIGDQVLATVVLSLFVLVGNPLIVLAIMGAMGYRRRTGFLAGLTVAQISEFSIVFVAMGVALGHVGDDALRLTTLVGLVTIATSTYMILYSHALYERLAPWLRVFERRVPWRESGAAAFGPQAPRRDAVVFGLGRYGLAVAEGLAAHGLRVAGVDFDPEVVRRCAGARVEVRYGDATDAELFAELPPDASGWLVAALPDVASNREFVANARRHGFRGPIAVVARDPADTGPLTDAGATTVLYPIDDAAGRAADTLAAAIRAPGAAR